MEQIGTYTVQRWLRGGGREVCVAEGRGGRTWILALFDIEDDRAKFLAGEIERCLELDHPAIGRIQRMFDHDGWRVVGSEHIDGVSLQQILEASADTPLAVGAAIYIAERLFSALAAAHAATDPTGRLVPLVHAELGPKHVMISWSGEVKLIGLGFAPIFQLGAAKRDLPSAALPYQPPECRKHGALTVRGNVYSAAALTWALLTGAPPSPAGQSKPLSALRPEVPGVVSNIITSALQPSLLQRMATCVGIAKTLQSCGAADEAALKALLKELGIRASFEESAAAFPQSNLSDVPAGSLPPIVSLPPDSDRFADLVSLPPDAKLPMDLSAYILGGSGDEEDLRVDE